jgi:hypothetical protein
MIDARALQRAVFVGITLQLILALLGDVNAWIAIHGFWFLGMMISATAAYLYAQDIGPGYQRGVLAGAIIGGSCAMIGFAVSVVLGDTSPHEYWLRSAVSILTGAVGGPFGQMSFNLKKMGY